MSAITDKRRQLRAEARRRKAEMVPRLRTALREARRAKGKRLRGAQARCDTEAQRISQAITAVRVELRVAAQRLRQRTGAACRLLKGAARLDAQQDIDQALHELDHELATIRALRQGATGMRDPRGQPGGRRAAELRAEAFDAVRANIGDDAIIMAAFERIKHRLKPSRYRSLTEAFWEYLADHPEMVEDVTADLERQWADEAEHLIGRFAKVPAGDDELAEYFDDLDEAERYLQAQGTTGVPF